MFIFENVFVKIKDVKKCLKNCCCFCAKNAFCFLCLIIEQCSRLFTVNSNARMTFFVLFNGNILILLRKFCCGRVQLNSHHDFT